MADDKEDKEVKASDKKVAGPKSEDSKREGEVENAAAVEGANRDLEARRQSQHGDLTSSTGGANNPGQHGRDGGEINGQSNNPAPSEGAVDPSIAAEAAEKAAEDAENEGKDAPIKKL